MAFILNIISLGNQPNNAITEISIQCRLELLNLYPISSGLLLQWAIMNTPDNLYVYSNI